jgi:predicted dehydrogenase
MSKKKIGFIDYFIDEWHANNYPQMIAKSSFKDKFEVTLAWDKIAREDRRPIDQWCKEMNIPKASSIEQVVEECDCLIVLSPDNSEMHEELADLPLKSKKPVYIDKPIAPSLAAAKRLFEKADKYGTPMMSSSALRFGSALEKALKETIAGEPVHFAATRGGGDFQIYLIHQLEMLVMALGTGAKRVMQCGNKVSNLMVVDYEDGRRGCVNLACGVPFGMTINYGEKKTVAIDTMSDFFLRFIEALLAYFDTGKIAVPKKETLEIASLIEAGTAALNKMEQWVAVPK